MALKSIEDAGKIKLQVLIQDDPINNDISEWTDVTKYLPKPYNIQTKADESLDLAYITLNNTEISTSFQPFLKVLVKIEQDSTDTTEYSYWYIAEDNMTKTKGIKRYTHNIILIEETKKLERIICDTRTVTQPLYFDSTEQAKAPLGEDTSPAIVQGYWRDSLPLYSPMFRETNKNIKIPNCLYSAECSSGKTTVYSIDTAGVKKQIYSGTSSSEEYITITSAGVGNYAVAYTPNGWVSTGTRTYYFTVMDREAVKSKISIKQVVENILETYKTFRIDENLKWKKTRIKLAQVSTGDRYVYTSTMESIISPEFSFGKMSLWEIFSAIGGKLHAIPRLKTDIYNTKQELYFERLDAYETTPQLLGSYGAEKYAVNISEADTQSIEQFCDKIDTSVENLVDTESVDTGSVAEPNDLYYKTLRNAQGTVVVQETGSLIQLQYGIERLIKLECGYLPDGTYVGDLTDYVYEATEYNSLSSYAVSPPAKYFALYYTYGDNKIEGLTFKPEQAWANVYGLGLFNYYAIINIIATKLRKLPSAISQLFTNEYDLRFLQFKVTYIPRISARVTQAKPLLEDNKTHSTITYNQTANLVSALAYGDNLKGAVSRFGRKEISQVYYTRYLADLVKPNMINRDNKRLRVSQVNLEIYDNFYKQEVQYSLDFNRYSQYVGVENALRFYEISEKQIAQRQTIYEEYAVLSYNGSSSLSGVAYITPSDTLMNTTGLRKILNSFIYNSSTQQVDSAYFKGFNASGKAITDNYISLPALSLGIGNSIYLNFRCEDNYSAGDYIEARENSGKYYDIQTPTPYCDYYGNIETLEVEMGTTDKSGAPTDFTSAWTLGNKLPNYQTNITPILATGTSKRIKLKKDSRETLDFTYQLHFIADDSNIVIGSGFARFNGIVTSQTLKYGLYVVSDNEISISNLTNTLDLTNRTLLQTFTSDDISVVFEGTASSVVAGVINVTATAPTTINGVAIVEQTTGAFIFGVKRVFGVGEQIELPRIYLMRDFKEF